MSTPNPISKLLGSGNESSKAMRPAMKRKTTRQAFQAPTALKKKQSGTIGTPKVSRLLPQLPYEQKC